jgi:hypothetical protein
LTPQPSGGNAHDERKNVKITSAALAGALALAAPLATATAAGAAPAAKAKAQVLGTVVTADDGTATVTARYVCPEGFHLWVSAKQVEDGRPDPRLQEEGSSSISSAWLQSHPTDFTCDGTFRTQTFQIDTAEQGFGEFQAGQAWVQFCLIGENTFISEARWVRVS